MPPPSPSCAPAASAATGCGSSCPRSPVSATARPPAGMPSPGSPKPAPTSKHDKKDVSGKSVVVLGSVDAQKLRSSMTLFEAAADEDTAPVFARVLDHLHDGARDAATLSILETTR